MAFVKNKLNNMNLRAAFTSVMLFTLGVVLVLSISTVVAGNTFQQWLFPQKDQLTMLFNIEYTDGSTYTTLEKIETGDEIFSFNQGGMDLSIYSGGKLISSVGGYGEVEPLVAIENMTITAERVIPTIELLSPKRKFAYTTTSVLMIVLPLLYAFVGVFCCTLWFYKRKLAPPIRLLNEAAEHIGNRDLDFSLKYDSTDEMGRLCASFETMRAALDESNKKQWKLKESQQALQASVAHDLRNPIAIIQGYVEHLQIQVSNHTLTEEKLNRTLQKLQRTSKRLENYTDSVREIVQIEEMELQPTKLTMPDALQEIAEDFRVVAEMNSLQTVIDFGDWRRMAEIDKQVLYRVLENIFLNAVRFAKTTIIFSCEAQEEQIQIHITDDGDGFPQEVLINQQGTLHFGTERHMGLGLAVCQTLCRKHNWEVNLKNDPQTHGARASVTIKTH